METKSRASLEIHEQKGWVTWSKERELNQGKEILFIHSLGVYAILVGVYVVLRQSALFFNSF